ncbi:MAG: hypothetical protein FJ090_03360 [Deltaproteobacteria bacterium]|nr:hypothetical protein [Deltaproteobacteria bacterium]
MGLRDRLRHLVRGPSPAPVTVSRQLSTAPPPPRPLPAPLAHRVPGAREVERFDAAPGPVHVCAADPELAAAAAELFAARGELSSWSVRA